MEIPTILAGQRKLSIQGVEIAKTPLLVPSFSSRAFTEPVKRDDEHKSAVQQLLSTMEEVITDAVLVSAYDVHYKNIETPITFPTLIFLDSGGYESSKDHDLSELGYTVHKPKKWKQDYHRAVLDSWGLDISTAFISFDHPCERMSLAKQIERAKDLLGSRTKCLKELLIKPESNDEEFLSIESILTHIESLKDFDIIGFTEKELGGSVLERMAGIARVRMALKKLGAEVPLHIFGSLDTLSTPLYFISGADIFDGLTWIRFAFTNGYTAYQQNFGALKFGIQVQNRLVRARSWYDNIYYLSTLTMEMRRFCNEGKFDSFQYNSEFLKSAYQSLIAELKGVSNG